MLCIKTCIRTCIFFIITLLLTLGVNSEQNEEKKFSVVSTAKPLLSSHTRNDQSTIDDQLEIRRSLVETKHRLERFEIKMTEVQNSLNKLLEGRSVKKEEHHNVKLDPEDVSKIVDTIEEKLKLNKLCDNIPTQIEKKLEQIKDEVMKEIDEKHKVQTEYFAASLEKTQQYIVGKVVSEISTERKAIEILENKLDANKVTEEGDNFKRVLQNKLEEQEETTTIPPVVEVLDKNCKEILDKGNVNSGVYTIKPRNDSEPFKVLCDMSTRGGGWTTFMKRFDGSQDFYLNWTDYKQGFGRLEGEFWLGLEHLYELTGSKPNELLFVLSDWEGKTVYSHFQKFSIGDEKASYETKVIQGYTGDGGQSFINHINRKFSTLDKHDTNGNCVKTYHGPWWYGGGCFHVKLTGNYFKGAMTSYADGIHYMEFHGYKYGLKEVKMMVRP